MDQAVKQWQHLALLFPGQGSHHVGMGQKLASVSRAARDVFRRADEVLEMSLSGLCFEGPEEQLEATINQQPATFVVSMAWLAALRERWAALDRRLQPDLFAGHSMGEFTAAVAAGSISFDDGLLLVKERGILMDEAGREHPGGMASVLGLSEQQVRDICAEAATDGPITLATANCEGQNVISGALKPLERAMDMAQKAGARKVVRLPISIGSHSPLMAKASEGMSRALKALSMHDPQAPMVGNINAELLETASEVHAELRDQLVSGIRWQKSVEVMKEHGVDMFIEVGPGNVLTRLVRRIDYELNSLSISDEFDGLLAEDFHLVEAAAQ
ncbi:MAG: ACP S-malonyltransferase [Dehalococcoidia bacterium]